MAQIAVDKSPIGGIVWTEGQKIARLEIQKAVKPRGRYLLTGNAGVGKTLLMCRTAGDLAKRGLKVAATAPTHKAVAVLRRKLDDMGLAHIETATIQSLLSLEPKPDDMGVLRLVRRKHAPVPDHDVVIVDETSMVSDELARHIDRLHSFVLYCGDPAQLPPVNEVASPTFDIRARSHLTEVVRQERDNPVLATALAIRDLQQTDDMHWDWCKPAKAPPRGVYLPGDNLDAWLRKAFLSPDFQADNDTFRYLCWTNARVASINQRIRSWIYGDTDTPFCPGERVLIRQPIVKDDTVLFNTNEEAPVISIKAATYRTTFKQRSIVPGWNAEVPAWRLDLAQPGGEKVPVFMPRSDRIVDDIAGQLAMEAKSDRKRWEDLYKFKSDMARLQAVYALTTHTSQGSTFRSVFLDVPDIRRRERSNSAEMKKILYVGSTRPTTSLMLCGV